MHTFGKCLLTFDLLPVTTEMRFGCFQSYACTHARPLVLGWGKWDGGVGENVVKKCVVRPRVVCYEKERGRLALWPRSLSLGLRGVRFGQKILESAAAYTACSSVFPSFLLHSMCFFFLLFAVSPPSTVSCSLSFEVSLLRKVPDIVVTHLLYLRCKQMLRNQREFIKKTTYAFGWHAL